MKRDKSCLSMVLAMAFAACSPRGEDVGDRTLAEPYLGQPPPGDTAVLFARGMMSLEGRYEFGVSFSPGGLEAFVSVQDPEGPARVLHFRAEGGLWTGPREVALTRGEKTAEMEAFFTPDGRRVYFAPYDEGMDVRLWAVERSEGGWENPRPLPSPVADAPAFFPTTTAEGVVYYSNLAERRIFRAWPIGEFAWTVQDTGLEAMHAFIAPDESYVLLDIRIEGPEDDPDIFVAFREDGGSWSQPIDLGPGVNSDFSETCPSLSPDGRFIFFSRYNEPGGLSDIYWVSSSAIRSARERARIPG